MIPVARAFAQGSWYIMKLRVTLNVLLALAASLQAAPVAHAPLAAAARNATTLGKLRLGMLKWYCGVRPGTTDKWHEQERPCVNFVYMQKLRAANDSGERKSIIQARTDSMPKDKAARDANAAAARAG